MRAVKFEQTAYKDYCQWALVNPKIVERIAELLKDIEQTPFNGKGKPEPLKHQYSGYWSRRINRKHRLVYKVSADVIFVAKCRGHYS